LCVERLNIYVELEFRAINNSTKSNREQVQWLITVIPVLRRKRAKGSLFATNLSKKFARSHLSP
jgi:hypothetical protein